MKYIKIILAIWCGFAGLLLLFFSGMFAYNIYFSNHTQHNIATDQDVRFVLNWPGLGDERMTTVLNSYESARSMTGDHLDAYEIQTSGIAESELQDPKAWERGDQLEGVIKEGVLLATSFVDLHSLSWFPGRAMIMSNEIYVYSWSVYFHGKQATAAKLIFAKPSDNKIFYVSIKM